MTQVVVLTSAVTVTAVGPSLPISDHLDRPVSVCFCGLPVRSSDGRCPECGWRVPWRSNSDLLISDRDDELLSRSLMQSLTA